MLHANEEIAYHTHTHIAFLEEVDPHHPEKWPELAWKEAFAGYVWGILGQ